MNAVTLRSAGRLFGRILLPLTLLIALNVAAQESPDAAAPPAGAPGEVSRPLRKIRQGSMLHKEEPEAPMPDLRTPLERERDALVAVHVGRVAELDVIAELARSMQAVALQESVDDVRRKEQQRYFDAMRKLQERMGESVKSAQPTGATPQVGAALPQASYRDAVERARSMIHEDSAKRRLQEIEREIERERVHPA